MVNSTVSGNSASHSGGIRVAGSAHLTVVNSTITDNNAEKKKGSELFSNLLNCHQTAAGQRKTQVLERNHGPTTDAEDLQRVWYSV
jgi:hypothetical protein